MHQSASLEKSQGALKELRESRLYGISSPRCYGQCFERDLMHLDFFAPVLPSSGMNSVVFHHWRLTRTTIRDLDAECFHRLKHSSTNVVEETCKLAERLKVR